VQWWRQVSNEGPGRTRASVDGQLTFYIQDEGGLLTQVDQISLQESLFRNTLGWDLDLIDWRERAYSVPGINVGQTLVIEATGVGAVAWADLTDYFPGGMTAQSAVYFSLTGVVTEVSPAPPPVVKEIPTLPVIVAT